MKDDPFNSALQEFLAAALRLLEGINADNHGENGTGGNGGIYSKDTLQRADYLRAQTYKLAKIVNEK